MELIQNARLARAEGKVAEYQNLMTKATQYLVLAKLKAR